MYKVVSYSLTYFLIDCIFLAIDNCSVYMCGNGTCEDGIDTYTCNCDENFFGDRCEPAEGKQITIVLYLQICFVPAEGVDNAIKIVTHPQNVTAELNELVNLTCRAESEALINYEWSKDDVPIGPMSNSLIIRDISPSDRGVYICTASTAKNSTNSTPALVTIRGMIIVLRDSIINLQNLQECSSLISK